MASENNDISDIVKNCKILLLDIEGTTTSISFVKDQLFPYAEANVKGFLESQWDTADVKEVVAALRKLAIEDEEQKVVGAVAIPPEDAGKEEQIEGLVKSVKWQMSADRKAGPLKQLQGLIWKQGYDNGDIKGHVYEDVAPALSLWNSTKGQKVYIYSSGSVQAQKLLFSCSVAGDLLPQIEGHFDTAVGAKQEPASYAAIVESIGCKPDEILFLTDILKEAEAARSSGLHAALVVREGNSPLPADVASSYPVLQSFDKLTVTNKRKPEPQEQEIRAKIPKTDIEDKEITAKMEVSETAPEPVSAPSEAISTSEIITTETNNASEPEKMEVEEDAPIIEEIAITEKKTVVFEETGDTAVRIETIVEEGPVINEAGDAPVCDVEPVVLEESVEKTDKNETDKMEPESAENVKIAEIVIEPKEQIQEEITEEIPPVAEETLPAVLIQEVTNEKEIVGEGIELVDDLEPVVEEPPAVEMEDLSNVADVLDKECDEILLKVHDVTNLDNIPVKPLLNSIAEEDIEVEGGENTNDIVDSILDSEMELGEKLCEDIDINISNVQEVSETKTEAEVIPDKVDETKTEEGIVKTAKIPEVVPDASATTEVTNSDVVQECPVDVLSKSESITEVENNKLEVNTDVSLDIKGTEPEDNKMDSEESSATVVETQTKPNESEMLADSTAKLAETDELEQNTTVSVAIEPKETIEEQLNKMESDNVDTGNNQTEVNESNSLQTDTDKKSAESITEAVENKMEMEDTVSVQSEAKNNITEPDAANDNNVTPNVPEANTESKQTATKDTVMEPEAIEKINGNVNGDTEVNQNGDASKEEELSARLSVESGDDNKEMNGANGNGESSEAEKEQENKETEITDIKVKTVATDEPRTDPIEQPVEA